MATRNVKMYGVKCEWDGKFFTTKSRKARFCCDACRLSAYRAKKSGDGRTIHDLDPQALERLQQILTISKEAYNAIFRLLEAKGANTATEAIRASYFVADTLLENMERMKNG